MSTHNSGRRDAEAKRKAAQSRLADVKVDEGELSDTADEKRRPKRKSSEEAIMEDILTQPPPPKIPNLAP